MDGLSVEPYYTNDMTNNNNINDNQMNGYFEVVWKDLSYKVRHQLIRHKIILNNISGYYRSGEIMAIMGPSGCGKSSLLACLSGSKRKGVSGSISISTMRKVISRDYI